MSAWKDEIARMRFERDRFRALATARRKDAAAARKQRRRQDELDAMDRAHEYAATARQYADEMKRAMVRSRPC